MARDLTTRQQKVIKDYRDRGQRPNPRATGSSWPDPFRLVAGTRTAMLTRRNDVITDGKTTLAQRHRGGAAVPTSTAHPTQETVGRVLQNRRTAGSRLPTELQTTAGEDGCHTPAAGWGTPTSTSRTEEHRRGRSIRWTSFLPTRLPLTGGEDRTTRATPTGETGLSPPWQHQRQDPVDRVCTRPCTLPGSTNSRLEGLL